MKRNHVAVVLVILLALAAVFAASQREPVELVDYPAGGQDPQVQITGDSENNEGLNLGGLDASQVLDVFERRDALGGNVTSGDIQNLLGEFSGLDVGDGTDIGSWLGMPSMESLSSDSELSPFVRDFIKEELDMD